VQLQQVVLHLALKRVRRDERRSKIVRAVAFRTGANDGDRLRLSVQDTGAGFDLERWTGCSHVIHDEAGGNGKIASLSVADHRRIVAASGQHDDGQAGKFLAPIPLDPTAWSRHIGWRHSDAARECATGHENA